MARKQNARNLRLRRPMLIGAGETEKCYFEHLKRLESYKIGVMPRFCGNDSPYYMRKHVEEVLNDGGLAICAFDMDVSGRTETVARQLREFMAHYASHPDVILCGSMPSIEYWFLLHFERTNRYFGSSVKVIEALRQYMGFEKTERFLRQPGWVQRLLADGGLARAMTNAETLGESGESHTRIPEAIRYLEEHK